MSDDQPPQAADQGLVALRIAIGLAQGLALYLLYSAFDAKAWPATDGHIFAPLALAACFVPLILIQGAGNLRAATLVLWALAAACIIAALAWYDIWRAWPVEYGLVNGAYEPGPKILPSSGLAFFLATGLFIAHALISGGDAERKFMASYPTHFDVAWKMGVQAALAVCFVGAFWLVLWLGAALFDLIKLDFFRTLIEHRWFAIPATALATAASLHVSDVRAGLVRGVRTLALALLSWLLPLMALIAAGFLVGLVFTGFAPLWATRHASQLLLVAAAVLVVLVNAAHQDGRAERRASAFFGLAIRLGSLLLVPIVAIAAYAIWLRVRQYGWTSDRIVASACATVAACYAAGYALNAFAASGRLIETWNFVTALLVLAVLGALFSPLADPARISVASQLAQLTSGKIAQDKFDLSYLRWQGERFGREALLRLAKDRPALRGRIAALMSAASPYGLATASAEKVASGIRVWPKGAVLPQGFVASAQKTSAGKYWLPLYCLDYDNSCDAILLDFDGDGVDEVLLGAGANRAIFHKDADGQWRGVATLATAMNCEQIEAALRSGKFKWIAPQTPRWRAIDLGVMTLAPDPYPSVIQTCPK